MLRRSYHAEGLEIGQVTLRTSTMARSQSKTIAAPTWQRGFFIAALVLLLSFPHYSCGQEAATISADEATPAAGDTTADAGVVGDDVTDLGDVVGDAMADLTDLVENLDTQNDEDAAEVVDDVDGKSTESATPTEPSTEAEETAEDDSAGTTDDAADPDEVAQETDAASSDAGKTAAEAAAPVVQSGPFIDLLGESLLSLEMVDEGHAQVHQHYTNEALSGKKVVGLYFSADWLVNMTYFIFILVIFICWFELFTHF